MEITRSLPTCLGLTKRETERWSLVRTVNAIEQDPLKMPGAEFERDCSKQIEQRIGRPARPGFLYVPLEVQQRTMIVGTASSGGYLVGVQTYAPGASFASALRAHDPLSAFNIERVGPMLGDFSMPQVSTAPAAGWVTENGTSTNSQPKYSHQLAQPKTCMSYFPISRPLLKSAPPEVLDAIAISESGISVSAAVAAAFVNGAGTAGEPTGLLGVSGVGTALGTSIAFADVLALIEDVEGAGLANPARAGFIIGTGAAKLLRTRERQSGAGSILQGGQIEGYRAIVTGACPSNAVLFGDMSRAALAEWGVLEIGADPFTAFQSGIVAIRAAYSVDVLCLQPSAFSVSTGVT